MEKIKIGSNIKLIYDLSELTENARKEIDTVKCYLSTSNGASEYNLDLCGDVQTSFNPIENIFPKLSTSAFKIPVKSFSS